MWVVCCALCAVFCVCAFVRIHVRMYLSLCVCINTLSIIHFLLTISRSNPKKKPWRMWLPLTDHTQHMHINTHTHAHAHTHTHTRSVNICTRTRTRARTTRAYGTHAFLIQMGGMSEHTGCACTGAYSIPIFFSYVYQSHVHIITQYLHVFFLILF